MPKFLFSVVLCIITFISIGCTKKVIKLEPPPEPIQIAEPVKPPPPPVEKTLPIDMDALLRENLTTIYFDSDKYDLKTDAISSLEQIVEFLKKHQSVRLLAKGHCDEHGSAEYNMGLGENRSKAVKKYLIHSGINAGRIETTSYGKKNLVQTGCGSNDLCNQANRRVDWQVLAK